MSEQRKTKRVQYQKKVQYQTLNGRELKYSISWDISQKGIKVQLDENIPINSILCLVMKLPNNNNVELKGKVLWTKKLVDKEKYLAGLEIVDAGVLDEAKKQIDKIVTSQDFAKGEE